MSYLLDTDICIYILNGPTEALQNHFKNVMKKRICVSTLTEAELYYGSLHSSRPDKNRERVVMFLAPLEILPFDSKAAFFFAEIKETLTRRGKPSGVFDMLIAATARAHDLTLITNNTKHFDKISGLSVQNWLHTD